MHFRLFKRAAALALGLLFTAAAVFSVSAAQTKTRPLVYTALGDSIASGYRLSNSSDGYVSQYGAYLSAQTTNLARVGLDSAGLLKLLSSDSNVMNHVKNSDIVTISIGGNDLLPIFSSLKPASLTALISAVQTINSAAMQQKFQDAVTTFGANWDGIIAQVKKLAPHAQIVATTLIDPYEGIVVSVPLLASFDLGSYADRYIKQMDTVITGHAQDGGYAVADAYSLFKQHKSQKLTNADLSTFDFDPHPNTAGHRLLFQAHQAVALDFTQNALSITGPSRIVVPAQGSAASGTFSAQPLLTCFTQDGGSNKSAFIVEDAGGTGAAIDAVSGTLTVHKPGTVRIKATLTSSDGKLSAEGTQTVIVTQALLTRTELERWGIPACIGLAVLAVVLLAMVLPRRHRRR